MENRKNADASAEVLGIGRDGDHSLGRGLEAASEAEAIAKGAEEFKQPKERLMAVRRG